MTPDETGDERRLVRACLDGDARARRELVERLAPRVHAVASHFFGRDAATAADVTQEVLVKALTRLPEFRGDSSLATWLHRITVRACLDARRSTRRLQPLAPLADGSSDPPAPGADQEERSRRDQRAQRVRDAVARLPEKLRVAVLLRHFEDLSYDEMAQALGCSEGTVASRLSRGHARLAEELRGLKGDLP